MGGPGARGFPFLVVKKRNLRDLDSVRRQLQGAVAVAKRGATGGVVR